MAFYDILEGYFNYGSHLVAITNDLMYARSLVLISIKKHVGELAFRDFMRFEEAFVSFVKDSQYPSPQFRLDFHFSVRDYKYQIRHSQVKLAIGGLSTVKETT